MRPPYRQITNVADSGVNTTSTDAINGSQLYKTVFGLQRGPGRPDQIRQDRRHALRDLPLVATADGTRELLMPTAGGG